MYHRIEATKCEPDCETHDDAHWYGLWSGNRPHFSDVDDALLAALGCDLPMCSDGYMNKHHDDRHWFTPAGWQLAEEFAKVVSRYPELRIVEADDLVISYSDRYQVIGYVQRGQTGTIGVTYGPVESVPDSLSW